MIKMLGQEKKFIIKKYFLLILLISVEINYPKLMIKM